MGQKVNPISLRLETTNRGFDSCYYNQTHSTQLFVENLKNQLYLTNFLQQTGFSGGRVLISTFFRGCEANLFYFNPLYSRENKGKRFMIKSSRIGSGKEKEREISLRKRKKDDTLSLSIFQKSNFKKRLEKENTFLFFFQVKPIFFLQPFLSSRKENSKDLNKITVSDSFSNPLSPSSPSDICKQLSFLVFFYQLREKRSFFIKSNHKVEKDTLSKEEKRDINNLFSTLFHTTNFSFFKEETFLKFFFPQSLLKEDKEKGEKIKDLPLPFPSVPTLSNFLSVFCSGFNLKKKKDGKVYQIGKKKNLQFSVSRERDQKGGGDFDILPSFQEKQVERRSSSLYPLDKDFKTFKVGLKENSKADFFFTTSLNFSTERNFPTKEFNSHYLEERLKRDTGSVFYLSFLRALNSTQSALFLCQEIVYYLEKRVSFQRIKSVLLEEVSRDNRIKGIRVTCSGRAGGKSKRAQRSKMETFMNGQTSLGVFSSKIDFHCENGLTGFGLVGVKVWICYP